MEKKILDYLRYAMPLAACLFMLLACEPEGDPDPDDDGETPGPVTEDFLVFRNFTKVNAPAPAAAAGGDLKINFKDSIYVVNGHPYMARVAIWHDPSLPINGAYISIENFGNNYHYDVMEEAFESNDSISVVYVGLQPPDDAEDVTYPYTIEIDIRPHTTNGTPQQEFNKTITVEDPVHVPCSIMNDDNTVWQWKFTERYAYSGGLAEVMAPSYRSLDPSYISLSGCCVSGVYVPFGEGTGVDGICNDQNPHWRTVEYSSGYFLVYDYLLMYESGAFAHYSQSTTINLVPGESVCAGHAIYDRKTTAYTKTGTHNYTPGATELSFTTTAANPPFGPNPPRGEIVFTCHTLIFTQDVEGKIVMVYQRYPDQVEPHPDDPFAFQWYR